MHLSLTTHPLLLFLSLLTQVSTTTSSSPQDLSSTLTFSVPASLPPLISSTHARLHTPHHLEVLAPVTTKNTFIFPLSSLILPPLESETSTTKTVTKEGREEVEQDNVREWYLTIISRDYTFAPYVVSVAGNGSVVMVYSAKVGRRKVGEGIRLEFAGTTSSTDDEASSETTKKRHHVVELRVRGGKKEYYQEREGFNPIALLKSPMILIGIVGLAFVIGVPYLLENMDPETRAEFEAQQKKSVFAGLAGASAGGGGPMGPSGGDMQNFDLASWMAGRGSGPGAGRGGSKEGEGSASGRDGGKEVRRRG